MTGAAKRRLVALSALLVAAVLVPAAAWGAQAGFSDRPKEVSRTVDPAPNVVKLAVGSHRGFDRVVLTFSGAVPGYRLAYVDQILADGSGAPVALRGSADLELVLRPATIRGADGGVTVPTTSFTPSYPTLREARIVGDFEGVVTVGIGAARRAGFRTQELANPPRLVVDLAHPPAGGGSGQGQTTTSATTTSRASGSTTTSTTDGGAAGGAATTSSLAPDTSLSAQPAAAERPGGPLGRMLPLLLVLAGAVLAVAGGRLVIAGRRRQRGAG